MLEDLDEKTSTFLKERSAWVRKETLRIHGLAPETRLASSLSCVEIFTILYYGQLLRFDPKNTRWSGRDRFIISKGHGAVSLYPVLADLGFFDSKLLERVCQEGSTLSGIPDAHTPGFETINGSLGHGLGVACGIAKALKNKQRDEKVFVLLGDGELYEGSIWEAVMFAGEHRFDNLIAIIDSNKACMLGYCRDIIDLEPLETKFEAFKWKADRVDGHNIAGLYDKLRTIKADKDGRPKVLIADTIKGKGVPSLESDPLSHVKFLQKDEINAIIKSLDES